MTRSWMTVAVGALSILLAGAAGSSAYSQEFEAKADEYLAACAVCHGADAKGGAFLGGTVMTPDLTVLAKNNDGKFPFLKIFQMVDGRAVDTAHGDRLMPVWGDRFKTQMGDKYGTFGSEPMVRARVLELVYYLQSIQVE